MSHETGTIHGSCAAADLHWISRRVFDLVGTWAAEADDASVAVVMATTSRHLSWHVADLEQLLAQLQPHEPGPEVKTDAVDDVIELGPPARYRELAEVLDSIRRIPGTVERLGVAERVLLTRLAVECMTVGRERRREDELDPVIGIVDAMLGDLRRDRDEGEFLLARLVADVVSVQQVGERVLEAERRLVEVGGLRPAAVG